MKRKRTLVRTRGIVSGHNNSSTCKVLAACLTDYFFAGRHYGGVLRHFGRPFAQLTPKGWVLMDYLPDCVLLRATRKLEAKGTPSILSPKERIECLVEKVLNLTAA